MADARMPQKGDQVMIYVTSGATNTQYTGVINDIDNGLICLKCTSASGLVDIGNPAMDVCIGIGTIYAILWTDDVKKVTKLMTSQY
jgi:hypothetical protein